MGARLSSKFVAELAQLLRDLRGYHRRHADEDEPPSRLSERIGDALLVLSDPGDLEPQPAVADQRTEIDAVRDDLDRESVRWREVHESLGLRLRALETGLDPARWSGFCRILEHLALRVATTTGLRDADIGDMVVEVSRFGRMPTGDRVGILRGRSGDDLYELESVLTGKLDEWRNARFAKVLDAGTVNALYVRGS